MDRGGQRVERVIEIARGGRVNVDGDDDGEGVGIVGALVLVALLGGRRDVDGWEGTEPVNVAAIDAAAGNGGRRERGNDGVANLLPSVRHNP